MYSSSGFKNWEIGDIDVFIHKGKYHLFHLIIPNHDYIAHAISDDGINWKRINNALFVGHPGEWDDDMLWTMHVSKEDNSFSMYYTGLKREDRGVVQKIGKATSKDLINWDKCKDFIPFGSEAPYYESLEENNPREWLSFRDPFLFEDEGEKHLLICARQTTGLVSRKGCVGLAKLDSVGKFQLQDVLFSPMVYDDIECPCAIKIKNTYYLIGSIREDLKIRYWFSDEFRGEYSSFNSNVLLPKGNYAARIVKEGKHILIYSFYFSGKTVNAFRIITPPKELDVDAQGRLVLKTFYRWEQKVISIIKQKDFPETEKILNNLTSTIWKTPKEKRVGTKSGYEIFAFKKPFKNFIWEGILKLENLGKCGLVLHSDQNGNGYYISLDFINGFVQVRKWGHQPNDVTNNFIFENLQVNQFKICKKKKIHFSLISFGSYIELSINGIVRLTLVDTYYTGNYIGIYSCSSIVVLKKSVLKELPEPETEYINQ